MSSPDGNYASDRHLLLQEIKSLGKEVARLRGDTRGLVQEEVRRGRIKSLLLGFVAFCLLAVPLALFYVQGHQATEDRKDFQRRTLTVCEARNTNNANFGRLLDVLLTQPRRPDQPPPDPKVLAAFKEYRATLKGVNCQRLLDPDPGKN